MLNTCIHYPSLNWLLKSDIFGKVMFCFCFVLFCLVLIHSKLYGFEMDPDPVKGLVSVFGDLRVAPVGFNLGRRYLGFKSLRSGFRS